MWVCLLLVFTSSVTRAGEEHDIHISLCELRWNESTAAFEVSVKIFIDDLELALRKDGASGLFVGTDRETSEADKHIAAYLRKHLRIEIDGVKLEPQYHGKEVTPDLMAVWCYVEFNCSMPRNKTFVLTNDILLDIYTDQRNIIDIRMGASHKAYTIFQPGRSTWTYRY